MHGGNRQRKRRDRSRSDNLRPKLIPSDLACNEKRKSFDWQIVYGWWEECASTKIQFVSRAHEQRWHLLVSRGWEMTDWSLSKVFLALEYFHCAGFATKSAKIQMRCHWGLDLHISNLSRISDFVFRASSRCSSVFRSLPANAPSFPALPAKPSAAKRDRMQHRRRMGIHD